VRAFGQVFAFKDTKKAGKGKKSEDKDAEGEEGEEGGSDAVSIGIRGPVSIQPAFSVSPVTVTSTQITKSVNLEVNEKDPDRKAPDTMGMKHRVDYGTYLTFGAINPQIAEKTGFSDADADKLKEALRTLFRNDATSARPDGSMEVVKLIWWKHNCKNGQYSAAKLMRTVEVKDAGGKAEVTLNNYPDLIPQVVDGE
jgi:CRISPR-associated protein Csd2